MGKVLTILKQQTPPAMTLPLANGHAAPSPKLTTPLPRIAPRTEALEKDLPSYTILTSGDWLADAPEDAGIPYIEVPDLKKAPSSPQTRLAEPPRPAVESPRAAVAFQLPLTVPASDLMNKVAAELVVWREPRSAAAGYFRQVCDGLLGELRDEDRIILFALADGNHNLSAAVANVALAVTENHARRLLLIDCDPYNGPTTGFFGLAAAPGWSEWLAGMPMPQLIQDAGWPGLHVIAAGNRLAAPPVQPARERANGLLQQTRGDYDLVAFLVNARSLAATAALLSESHPVACLVHGEGQAASPAVAETWKLLQTLRYRGIGSLVVAE